MKIEKIFLNKKNRISRPYIIAEAGVNHEGSMYNAKKLIEQAKEGGADAVKFQSYKAKTLASRNSPSYWDTSKESTKNQFELFSKYDKFWKKEFESLKLVCDDLNIDFLSTPFDFESASFLNPLMESYKISSSDLNNKPLIEAILKYNKPLIISTGASKMNEIQETVDWIYKKNKNLKIALLHCILNYPTNDEDASLNKIIDLKNRFPNIPIGYSDHTLPNDMSVCLTSWLIGAKIIEKHFTFNKKLEGNDHYHSMDVNDLKLLIKKINHCLNILGDTAFDSRENEKLARLNARRGIYSTKLIKRNSIIKSEDLILKRPFNNGINPKDINKVIGCKSLEDINEDTLIKWEKIKK